MVHQDPAQLGSTRSRWTLGSLWQAAPELRGLLSVSGVWRRLKRWRIVRKRGGLWVHSPDPAYREKMAAVEAALEEARARPEEVVVTYLDEMTVYREPVVGLAWGQAGRGGACQPRAVSYTHLTLPTIYSV